MEDFDKLVDLMKHYPSMWKPYHKDYNNQKVLDEAWIEVTKKYTAAKLNNPDVIINWCSEQMVNKSKQVWREILNSFLNYFRLLGTHYELAIPAFFDRAKYLKCGLSMDLYKNYGYAELFRRYEKLSSSPRAPSDVKDIFHRFARELKQKDAEERELNGSDVFGRSWFGNDALEALNNEKPKLEKGCLEKAVLIDSIRSNPWLWESKQADFMNVTKCEESWKLIAQKLSESDDYYYVWKYQRMWQALVHRFLVQLTEKRKLCSHFDQMKDLIKKKTSLENQIIYVKQMYESSINFVNLSNEKLAKDNKIYELRPDVIKGYNKIINEIPQKKLEESENAPYFIAMQELLKRR